MMQLITYRMWILYDEQMCNKNLTFSIDYNVQFLWMDAYFHSYNMYFVTEDINT